MTTECVYLGNPNIQQYAAGIKGIVHPNDVLYGKDLLDYSICYVFVIKNTTNIIVVRYNIISVFLLLNHGDV